MNTDKKIYTALVAIVAATVFTIASPVYAQRDAGAKIRGEYDSFRPSRPQPRSYSRGFVETQRRFSYEPAESHLRQRNYSYVAARFHAGDQVVVSTDEARLMIGTETRGTLDKGTIFEVRKVEGPWLGTEVEIDGQKASGWVWYGSVTLSHEPSDDSAASPQAARRSFSYEPSYETRRRETSPRKPAWKYQKTDPRRYRP